MKMLKMIGPAKHLVENCFAHYGNKKYLSFFASKMKKILEKWIILMKIMKILANKSTVSALEKMQTRNLFQSFINNYK